MTSSSLDPVLLKKKLLYLASSGSFTNFTPQQLHDAYEELQDFLIVHHDKLLDSIELFNLYELQFYLSVLTLHDIEAKNALDRITDQFSIIKTDKELRSQRIAILQSIYAELQGDLKHASKLLSEDPDELKLSRRLTTLSRHDAGDSSKYINNLIYYLNLQPSDVQTWNELGEQYKILGHYDKAIYCLKEIVLQDPQAYPIFYKMGLLYYYLFLQLETNLKTEKKDKLFELMKVLINARDNYLYSLEINDTYKKNWVGLKALAELGFNDKLKKISESSKEIKEYLSSNDKLKVIIDKKIKELNIEI
ncbi:TPR repeat protein oca3 [Candida viswanathii]|uniref:ER membrane protein complex subunit 2 n=1 Tax=Candida viswanathii TaxID=5486 RepID=A0A367YGI3_9ASCO|nr:TPR repeat protein oca3 [Candida viswanathii]